MEQYKDLQTWGEFRKYTSTDVWQMCFDREFTHRGGYGLSIPPGETFESIKDNDDDYRSFGISYSIGCYIVAKRKLYG